MDSHSQDKDKDSAPVPLCLPLNLLAERSLAPLGFLARQALLNVRRSPSLSLSKALAVYAPYKYEPPRLEAEECAPSFLVEHLVEHKPADLDLASFVPATGTVDLATQDSFFWKSWVPTTTRTLAIAVLLFLAYCKLGKRRRRNKKSSSSDRDSSFSTACTSADQPWQGLVALGSSTAAGEHNGNGMPRRVSHLSLLRLQLTQEQKEETNSEDSSLTSQEESSISESSCHSGQPRCSALMMGSMNRNQQTILQLHHKNHPRPVIEIPHQLRQQNEALFFAAAAPDFQDDQDEQDDTDASQQSTRSEIMTRCTQSSATLDVFWARQQQPLHLAQPQHSSATLDTNVDLPLGAMHMAPSSSSPRLSCSSRHSLASSVGIGALDLRKVTNYLQNLYDEIIEDEQKEYSNNSHHGRTLPKSDDSWGQLIDLESHGQNEETETNPHTGRSMVKSASKRRSSQASQQRALVPRRERSMVVAAGERRLTRSRSSPLLSTTSTALVSSSRPRSTGRRRTSKPRNACMMGMDHSSKSHSSSWDHEVSILVPASKQPRRRRRQRRASEESFPGSSSSSRRLSLPMEGSGRSNEGAKIMPPSALKPPGTPSKGPRRSVSFNKLLYLEEGEEENDEFKAKDEDKKESPTSTITLFLDDDDASNYYYDNESLTEVSGRLEDMYDDSDQDQHTAELLALPMFGTSRNRSSSMLSVTTVQTNTDLHNMSYRLLDIEEFEQAEKESQGVISNMNVVESSSFPRPKLPQVDTKCVSSSHRRKLRNARLVVRVVLGKKRKDYKTSVACFEAIDIVTDFRKELHRSIQELSKGHQVLSDVKEAWSKLWQSEDDGSVTFPSLPVQEEMDDYECCIRLVQKIFQRLRPRSKQGTVPNTYTEIGSAPQGDSDEDLTLFLGSVGGLPVSLPLNFVDSDRYKRTRLTPYKHDQHLPLSLQDALRVVRSVLGPSHKRVSGQDCLRAIQMYGLLKIQFKKLSEQLKAQRSFVRELKKDLERFLGTSEKVSAEGGATETIAEIITGTRQGKHPSATMDTSSDLYSFASEAERIRELLFAEHAW